MQISPPYRTNRDLFSNHYLDELLPKTDVWTAIDDHPGILACHVETAPERIAAAVRRIDRYSDDLTNDALNVPGRWV